MREEPGAGSAPCWNCRKDSGGAPFCPGCGVIQPLPRDTDFFALLEVKGRLDFSEAEIETVYHDLSRRFHPDFYRQKSEKEREASLQNSALLNRAYRTLKDPFLRAEYVLDRNGLGIGEMKQVPAELLEEVLELQETLADLKAAGPSSLARGSSETEAIRKRVGAWEARLRGDLAESFRAWDADSEDRARLLERMRQVILQRRYVGNLVKDVAQFIQA